MEEGSKAMPFRRCVAQSPWPTFTRLVCPRAAGHCSQEWSRQDVHLGCLELETLENPHHHSERENGDWNHGLVPKGGDLLTLALSIAPTNRPQPSLGTCPKSLLNGSSWHRVSRPLWQERQGPIDSLGTPLCPTITLSSSPRGSLWGLKPSPAIVPMGTMMSWV